MLCFLNQFFHGRTDGTKFIHEGPDAKQNLYFFMSGNCCKRRLIVLVQGLLQSNSLMKEVLQSTPPMKELLQSTSLMKELLQSNSLMKEVLQSNSFMKELLQSSSAMQTLLISKLNLVNQPPTTLKLSRYPCQMS